MDQHASEQGLNVVVLDGATIRADLTAARSTILPVVADGGAVLTRGFLTIEEVEALRNEAVRLAKSRSAHWEPYRHDGPDFHHVDMHSIEDNQRRINEGRPLRQRRFHLHKFFLWNQHPLLFESAVRDVIRLRNALYGLDEMYGVNIKSGYFTVIHVTHYRRGGDFLCEHSDADFHERQGLKTKCEILTFLSKKGKDFHEGGLFIRKDKTYYSMDDEMEPGDIIIYDVSQLHGCAPVDPGLDADPEGILGRWLLLVPPYSVEKHIRD